MTTVADKLAQKSAPKPAPKQVRLRLVYVDFWSAVKISFLAGVALAIVTIVSSLLIFLLLQATGLIARGDEFLTTLLDGAFVLSDVIALPQVLAFSTVTAIVNLVVVTVLGAVVAGIYNVAVKITGGLLVGFTSN